jgi:probable rRNA maturation factor
MTVEINNESGSEADSPDSSQPRFSLDGLVRLAEFSLAELRIHPQAELSILLVDADTMAAYHEKYMGEPGPTDVLSFPMDELRIPDDEDEPPLGLLGDIVLCPEVTARQAAEHGRTPEAESEYLLVHGLLHLLGFDHGTTEERSEMFGLKDNILQLWDDKRGRSVHRPATDPAGR